MVATMAMTTKMARNAPKTISIFFWPFGGFGSSTGCMATSVAPRVRGGCAGAAAQRAASSSTVRLRPATQPTSICGIIRAVIRAIGRPQPPLLW